jgi:spermidine synthase
LVIASLNPGVEFRSFDHMKEELEAVVLDFRPKGIQGKILFLTDGDNCGEKKSLYEDREFIVEDYVSKVNGEPSRRMIATSDPSRWQSVIKLKYSEGVETAAKDAQWGLMKSLKGNSPDKECKFSEFEIHNLFLACLRSFGQFPAGKPASGLVLGGGCGIFSDLLMDSVKNLTLDEVEISQTVVDLGEKYFFAKKNQNKTIHVTDALKFVENKTFTAEDNKYNFVVVDVNSGERQLCPPENFRTKEFVEKLHSLVENDGGVVLVNVVHYNHEQLDEVATEFVGKFDFVCKSHAYENSLGNSLLVCVKGKEGEALLAGVDANWSEFKSGYEAELFDNYEIEDMMRRGKVLKPAGLKERVLIK